MFKSTRTFQEKGRHTLYMVLDCETATLPFANSICKSVEEKKKIAIARPLIYDIGWTVVDSELNLYDRKSFLVTETFSVPSVFNTAYYKEKRPIYLEQLKSGNTVLKSWYEIVTELQTALENIDYVCAFNAMFDFKKAIPFTDLYISKVYGNDYQEWEALQKQVCQKIATQKYSGNSREFDAENFSFRGKQFPMIDIWGVACDKLINTAKFKRECLENRMITASGKFFKTSAEATYRYLFQNYHFEEAHTALDDAEIESYILHKALKKGKIPKGIIFFPFNLLGTTPDFLKSSKKGIKREHFDYVIEVIDAKLAEYTKQSSFSQQLESMKWNLMALRDDRF